MSARSSHPGTASPAWPFHPPQCYPGGAGTWPEGRVCKYCCLQARLRTGTCAACGALTSLPGLNAAGQPACTRCSGIPARFRCGCGREVTAGERGRCWWCVLTDLVTDALAGPGGEIPAHLRPLADGLVSMHRPQSGVAWLRRSAITRETLQDLARDRMPCSHGALDGAGADRAVEYLRLLLIRYGALPPRDRRLADFQRWAAAKLDTIGNAEHRRLLERFLRWRLLRHLRSGGTTAAPVGHGPYQRAKQRLTVAIAFLTWLDGRGRHLGDCTQHDIDTWFGTGPTTRRHVITDTSCADGATRLKLGADWLDVPEPVATPAAGTPAQPHQHDHGSQPGLAVAVSRAACRRTPQLPPARPRASPARHPRPGEPTGRLARARPRGTTRGPRRRARRLAGHGDAPRVPRRRRLVRLRRSKRCSRPGRQDIVVDL